MNYSRKEWISILNEIEAIREQNQKSNHERNKLKKQAKTTRILLIVPLLIIFTMVPLYMLYFFQTNDVPFISFFLFNVLATIIPGFYTIYEGISIVLILLLLYGLYAVRKENSLLFKIRIFRNIKEWTERKYGVPSRSIHRKKKSKFDFNVFSAVPDYYQHPEAISLMKQYLINKRAKNLTEAIELYELEMHRERVEDAAAHARYVELENMRRREEITKRNNLLK